MAKPEDPKPEQVQLVFGNKIQARQVEIIITNLDLAQAFSRYQRLVCTSEKINPLFSEL
jgi:hypothetical protein